MPPHLSRFRDLAERYDALICDVWGVLHNGLVRTEGAPEALAAFRESGKAVVLLTNAPRRPDSIARQLAGFGIGSEVCDAIVSSGGVAREMIEQEGDRPFYHLGPERDAGVYAGLSARPTGFEAAEYILCTGLFDDETENAETYRPLLEQARARDLRLLCANPDLVVERGDRLLPCAGALAALYETMGGEAVWIGKPKPLVYQIAREAAARALGRPVDPARILGIGDTLRTDLAGAAQAGIDALLILAGVHTHEIGLGPDGHDEKRLAALLGAARLNPVATMTRLVW